MPIICLLIQNFLTRGIGVFSSLIAYIHEKTNSYVIVLVELIAIGTAFFLPVQPAPEIRHFNRYRQDYEIIVQLVDDGTITHDIDQTCNKVYSSIIYEIEDRSYCVGVSGAEIIVSLYYEYVALVYTPQQTSDNACNRVSFYDGSLFDVADNDWYLCYISWYPY